MAISRNRFTLLVTLASTILTLTSAYYQDGSPMHSGLYAREADYDLMGDLDRRDINRNEINGLIVRNHIKELYARVNDPPAQTAGNPPAQATAVQNPHAAPVGQGGNAPGQVPTHPHIPPLNLAGVGHAGQAPGQGQGGNAPAAVHAPPHIPPLNLAAIGNAGHGPANIPPLNLAGLGRTRTDSVGSGTTLGNGDAQNPATRPKQPGMLSRAGQKVGSAFNSASRNRFETLNPNGPTDYAGMDKEQTKEYRKNYMLHHGGTSPRTRDYEAFRNNEAKEWNARNSERVQRAEGKKTLYDKKHMKANFRLGAVGAVTNAASAAGVIGGALKPRSLQDHLAFMSEYLAARHANAEGAMPDEDIWGEY